MNSVTRNTLWWSNTEFEGKMAGWATIFNSVTYMYIRGPRWQSG